LNRRIQIATDAEAPMTTQTVGFRGKHIGEIAENVDGPTWTLLREVHASPGGRASRNVVRIALKNAGHDVQPLSVTLAQLEKAEYISVAWKVVGGHTSKSVFDYVEIGSLGAALLLRSGHNCKQQGCSVPLLATSAAEPAADVE